jgi:hypothetical protein
VKVRERERSAREIEYPGKRSPRGDTNVAQTQQAPIDRALARTLGKIRDLDVNDSLIELETSGYTTWHGSFERTVPGVRMNLAVYCNRQHVQTQERHGDTVPKAVLERHADDERFKILLGGKQPYGWHHDGPDYALMARNPRGLYD